MEHIRKDVTYKNVFDRLEGPESFEMLIRIFHQKDIDMTIWNQFRNNMLFFGPLGVSYCDFVAV